MQKTKVASVAIVGALALTFLAAGPATAETSGDVTTGVTGGTLTISTVIGTASANKTIDSTNAFTISGVTVAVTVKDYRGVQTSWATTASVDAFTPAISGNTSMSGVVVDYGIGTVAPTGGITAPTGGSSTVKITSGGGTAVALVGSGPVTSSNEARWTSALTVNVPATVLADIYTTRVTHSVV
jgi:hypothetical protein